MNNVRDIVQASPMVRVPIEVNALYVEALYRVTQFNGITVTEFLTEIVDATLESMMKVNEIK